MLSSKWYFYLSGVCSLFPLSHLIAEAPMDSGYLWEDAELVDGWRNSQWYGWLNDTFFPWCWHVSHGWQYTVGEDSSSVWIWDSSLDSWYWTGKEVYPWIYVRDDSGGQWFYYQTGSTQPQRWFYHQDRGVERWLRERNLGKFLATAEDFSFIPAGEFGEGSYWTVLTRDFEIMRTEVTYELWTEVAEWAESHGYAGLSTIGMRGFSGSEDNVNHPVTGVDSEKALVWLNAWSEMKGLTPSYTFQGNVIRSTSTVEFLSIPNVECDFDANGYRLPMEAEWEYACRAGTTTPVYSGDLTTLGQVAWFDENSGGQTHPVAQKEPNNWGLYDMHGNVFEHCWNLQGSPGTRLFSGVTVDPAENQPASPNNDRMERGGSFASNALICRSSVGSRNGFYTPFDEGFRAVRSLVDDPSAETRIPSLIGSPVLRAMVGSSTVTRFGIQNNGSNPVTVTGVVCPEGFFAELSSETFDDVSYYFIDLTFTPTEAKIYSGRMELISNATGGATSVQLTGYGVIPAIPSSEFVHLQADAVTIMSDFMIQTTEVSWPQWNQVREWSSSNGYPDIGYGSFSLTALDANRPVYSISFFDVLKWLNAWSEMEGLTPCYYIDGLVYRGGEEIPDLNDTASGFRLPLGMEWEYACRAGTDTDFYSGPLAHFGEYPLDPNLDAVGWFRGNSGGTTHLGGLKEPNAWGLYDMHGNVAEWCWDFYQRSPPFKSTDLTRRMVRGGGWNSVAQDCTVVLPFGDPYSYESILEDFLGSTLRGIGFRPVRNAGE